MSYDDEFYEIDIQDIGDYIYGIYNEDIDEEKKDEDIYQQMFSEFNMSNLSQASDKPFYKDDILMQINIDEDKEKDDRELDDMIDRNLETRFFQNDPNSFLNSRVGMAERVGQDQVLGTIIKGYDKLAKKQEKINKMNLTSQQLFSITFDKVCLKYDINKNKVSGLLELLFQTQFYEYKNPGGCLFGYLCLKNKNIDSKQLKSVFDNYASQENISILDLVRYARFVNSLM
jgi:hypothetical protein